jgi:hypothetical protein
VQVIVLFEVSEYFEKGHDAERGQANRREIRDS